MEGVASAHFRRAIAHIGGFDEACTEFIRVSKNPHIESLALHYSPQDTAPIPQAAQIMGSDPETMAAMTRALIARGAPRIDLNCGCPSNTVTGRGAGSSLLRTPDVLYEVAKAMVDASSVPVTVKLRSGYEDTTLFNENLLAAQESGAAYITLHPRTKVEGYGPPANWALIRRAVELLHIPVVGNGDIRTIPDARRMIEETGCAALMIGRGALTNPWLFHEIKASYANAKPPTSWETTESYLRAFLKEMPPKITEKGRVNQLKQLFRYLFEINAQLQDEKTPMLRTLYENDQQFMARNLPLYKHHLFTN